jgi:hypothetical protein
MRCLIFLRLFAFRFLIVVDRRQLRVVPKVNHAESTVWDIRFASDQTEAATHRAARQCAAHCKFVEEHVPNLRVEFLLQVVQLVRKSDGVLG